MLLCACVCKYVNACCLDVYALRDGAGSRELQTEGAKKRDGKRIYENSFTKSKTIWIK